MPVDDRMYSHKAWPSTVRRVEMRQVCAMRICPPRAHEDGLHVRVVFDVRSEGRFHRETGGEEREVVLYGRGLNEDVHLRERVR